MVNFKEDEQLSTLNHSCAHLMAQAIKHLFPQAKFWVGPVVAEGFYYDVDLGDDVIRDEDITAIEKEMKKIAKSGKKIIRKEISKEEAMEMFKNDEYKLDLISNLEDGTISCYEQGDFTDLCRGPHVDNVKLCRNFKLIRHSGAYWKGDSKNKVLQRIYGVCFPTPEELEDHLRLLEEAKERDHRKIGKDMGLFMVDDLIGRGLPMFLPKGYTIWQELENYIKDKERKLGYLHDTLCRYSKPLQDIRSLGPLQGKYVPGNGSRRRIFRIKTDELPAPHDDLCKQNALLQGFTNPYR